MPDSSDLIIGAGPAGPVTFNLGMANRHGIIAGATGSGKTVTLQVLAELFSRAGVPVVAPDIKGDLSGVAMKTNGSDALQERAGKCGLESFIPASVPSVLWRLVRGKGHPLRTTVSEMGPLLLSSILGLNDTQEAVLTVLFRYADQEGLLLLDFKDLEALITWAQEESGPELERELGKMSAATLTSIKRQILVFEEQGGAEILGEPALEIHDLLRTTVDGRGYVNVIHAEESLHNPKSYTTFLLWLLSELFETLPEVGDVERPRLVFFFDEAHLLFEDKNSALVEKLEAIVRLIRSKGVGVYFVTQRPNDIPDSIASQLGNRIQHALRAFTPQERKALQSVAASLPCARGEDLSEEISALATGHALVSLLGADGAPQKAVSVMIRPPFSRIGALTDAERDAVMALSPVVGKYDKVLDRESAFEQLTKRSEERKIAIAKDDNGKEKKGKPASKGRDDSLAKFTQSTLEGVAKHFIRGISYRLGNQLIRGIMGSLQRR
jgi:DNA helicase HerA-like ATPase